MEVADPQLLEVVEVLRDARPASRRTAPDSRRSRSSMGPGTSPGAGSARRRGDGARIGGRGSGRPGRRRAGRARPRPRPPMPVDARPPDDEVLPPPLEPLEERARFGSPRSRSRAAARSVARSRLGGVGGGPAEEVRRAAARGDIEPGVSVVNSGCRRPSCGDLAAGWRRARDDRPKHGIASSSLRTLRWNRFQTSVRERADRCQPPSRGARRRSGGGRRRRPAHHQADVLDLAQRPHRGPVDADQQALDRPHAGLEQRLMDRS